MRPCLVLLLLSAITLFSGSFAKVYVAGLEGNDGDGCGDLETPCSSLSAGIERAAKVGDNELLVTRDSPAGNAVHFEAISLSIYGEGNSIMCNLPLSTNLIKLASSTLTLSNITFSNCSIFSNEGSTGGLLFIADTDITVRNVAFDNIFLRVNGTMPIGGGALTAIGLASTVTITQTTFTTIFVEGSSGGALWVEGCSLLVSYSVFANVTTFTASGVTVVGGGAVHFVPTGNLSMAASADMYGKRQDLNVTFSLVHSAFFSCYCTPSLAASGLSGGGGGAVLIATNLQGILKVPVAFQIVVEKSTFDDVSFQSYTQTEGITLPSAIGGAIAVVFVGDSSDEACEKSVIIRGSMFQGTSILSTFDDSLAIAGGGSAVAVVCDPFCASLQVQVRDCFFVNTCTIASGSAHSIIVGGGAILIDMERFVSSSIVDGVYVERGNSTGYVLIQVENNLFRHTSLSMVETTGGGMVVGGSLGLVVCDGDEVAGLCTIDLSLTINNCSFSNTTVKSIGGGGGSIGLLELVQPRALSISIANCSFGNSTLTVSKNGGGGAVFVSVPSGTDFFGVSIVSCLFAE